MSAAKDHYRAQSQNRRFGVDRSDRRTFLASGIKAGIALTVAGTAEGTWPTNAQAEQPHADLAASTGTGSAHSPGDLKVNGLYPATGVDPDALYFSWKLRDRRRGARQAAYRILVARATTPPVVVWGSGPVESSRQAFVAYTGPPLGADADYRWSVSTRDPQGGWSPYAPPSPFSTGLRPADWIARWLRPGPSEAVPETYTYVRKVLAPGGGIVRATAYTAAAHKFQLWVNGSYIEGGPSFSYPDEQYYQATDLTPFLRAAAPNVVGYLHHWYGAGSGRPTSSPGLLAQISIHHIDGTRTAVGTDDTWRQQPAEWLPAPPRNGSSNDFVEIIDARASPVGWSEPGFDDRGWATPAILGPVGTPPFTGLVTLRTRIAEQAVHPGSVRRLASGAVVADFGKIFAARPRVAFDRGVAGRPVSLHVGYALDPDGHVSTTHGVQSTDLTFTYIQRDGPQVFEPYTFLGFRYLEIDSPGEPLAASQIAALTRHAAMPSEPPPTFATDISMLDAVWALCAHSSLYSCHEQFVDTPTRQKGQFLSDAVNESEAVMYAYGEQNLSWQGLRDFARSQARFWPDGRVNDVYPDGSGAVDIPDFTELYPEWLWRYYLKTGDSATVQQYHSVVAKISDYVWRAVDPVTGLVTRLPGGGTDYQYGLVDFPPEGRYGYDMGTAARTTVNVLAVNVFNRAADIAFLSGDTHGVALQQTRSAALTSAINSRLVRTDGVYIDGLEANGSPSPHASQHASAFALAYGLVPVDKVATVGAHVADLGISMGPDNGLTLLRALHNGGREADLVRALTNPKVPGWAQIVASGGTFTWEDWVPSDLIGDSMSHGWGSSAMVAMAEALLGIEPLAAPGDQAGVSLRITPPRAGLRRASGSYPTVAGVVGVAWRRSSGAFDIRVTLPPNSSALLTIPTLRPTTVTESGRPVASAPGVQVAGSTTADITLRLGAGSYAVHSGLK
jgi:alpha-L-rhamnosidase